MTTLDEIRERYILHWGEMGPRWGVNRTVAQVHALLFITPEPLDAQTIMDALSISRGNVSMAVNELIGWGIARRVHVLGERREYYISDQDVWQMLFTVLEERKRREVDPTVRMLKESVTELTDQPGEDAAYARKRLAELLEVVQLGAQGFESISDRSPRGLMALARRLLKIPRS